MSTLTIENLPEVIVSQIQGTPEDMERIRAWIVREFPATSPTKMPLPNDSHKAGDLMEFVNARIAEQKADPEGMAKKAKECREELEISRNSWPEVSIVVGDEGTPT
jgi:hypothetical protein